MGKVLESSAIRMMGRTGREGVAEVCGVVAVVPLAVSGLDLLALGADEALLPAHPSRVERGVPAALSEDDVAVVFASRRGREGGVAVCREEALAVVVDAFASFPTRWR